MFNLLTAQTTLPALEERVCQKSWDFWGIGADQHGCPEDSRTTLHPEDKTPQQPGGCSECQRHSTKHEIQCHYIKTHYGESWGLKEIKDLPEEVKFDWGGWLMSIVDPEFTEGDWWSKNKAPSVQSRDLLIALGEAKRPLTRKARRVS
jgi:hypothetical protein